VSARQPIRPSPAGVPGALIDPSSVIGEDITYEGFAAEAVNGYLARPAQDGPPLPAMVVIHEAGGLGEHIRDVVNRLANLGFLALGVDLYTREGGPPPIDDLAALMQRLFEIPDARVLGDLEAAADLLRARGDVTGRVGCIGFCMGGRYTLLFATSSDRLDAAVDCWGGFIDRATPDEVSTETRPVPPLQRAEQLCCPLLAAVGAEEDRKSVV
jgi:carboxymethylenebutenolidase